jgi:hypothetical protein
MRNEAIRMYVEGRHTNLWSSKILILIVISMNNLWMCKWRVVNFNVRRVIWIKIEKKDSISDLLVIKQYYSDVKYLSLVCNSYSYRLYDVLIDEHVLDSSYSISSTNVTRLPFIDTYSITSWNINNNNEWLMTFQHRYNIDRRTLKQRNIHDDKVFQTS